MLSQVKLYAIYLGYTISMIQNTGSNLSYWIFITDVCLWFKTYIPESRHNVGGEPKGGKEEFADDQVQQQQVEVSPQLMKKTWHQTKT
jgi:hypothetical protein